MLINLHTNLTHILAFNSAVVHSSKKTRRHVPDTAVHDDGSRDTGQESRTALHQNKGKDYEGSVALTVNDLSRPQREASLGAMPDGEAKASSAVGAADVAAATGRSLSSLPFPAQLMNLLQRNVAPDALWFLEGGEAIGIDTETIVDKVLNEHLRGMKFNSMVRNLNRW